MADFAFDIVGFDLDGTLLDTSPDLADALNHVLALAGRQPLGIDAVRAMIGRGTRHMLERGLAATGGCEPSEADRLYAELIAHYEANIARGTRPYPGLVEALDALAGMGVRLGVATNKIERLAVRLLDEVGLGHRFATVIGGDTMGPGNAKPSGVPIREMMRRCGGGRAIFVGDSIHDVEAARDAGISAIAVGFGFSDVPVATLGADAVIEGYPALLPTLARLGIGSAAAGARST